MASDRKDQAREIRFAIVDVRMVCERLGMLSGGGSFLRQAAGLIVRCPWHTDKSPSCSVRIARDGTIAAKCHACGASGDVFSLVAAVHGLSTKRDFREVMILAAELGGLHAIVHELETGREDEGRPRVPPPRVELEPERDYPPQADVDALWAACVPTSEDAEVSAWLVSRGLDPETVDGSDLARALPPSAPTPWWASWQRNRWVDIGHRLLFPMRNSLGQIRSVRAGRVVDGESPKRLPPGGHRASAVVLADELGVALLSGARLPSRVVIVEGEPDYLAMATVRHHTPTAVIGIVSGSWTHEFAFRFPEGCGIEVILWTDRDAAGDRYASEIAPWLVQRGCFVRRDGRRAA